MLAPRIVPLGTENIGQNLFGDEIKRNMNESFT